MERDWLLRLGRRLGAGKLKPKGAPHPNLTLDPEGAAHVFYHALCEREAEAGPFDAGLLGAQPVERLE